MEEGEKKILEKLEMAQILAHKVKSIDNPWDNLALKYGNNRGKLFNEEEDRFLLCMTDKLGYGKWEELKREVRLSIHLSLHIYIYVYTYTHIHIHIYMKEEDRFLLCMTDKLGYGKWEELKREVRISIHLPIHLDLSLYICSI